MSQSPTLAIISAGSMGSAVSRVLTHSGCTVLTHLSGRSASTRKRAQEAGMQDASLEEIATRAEWVVSIVPPSEAEGVAEGVVGAWRRVREGERGERTGKGRLVYVDCNAVNPSTVHRISRLFTDTDITFLDASIIGGPPSDPSNLPTDGSKPYTPTFYASAEKGDEGKLDGFVWVLEGRGLRAVALKGEGVGVGDASALKMSYAGISKGIIGLFTTMILAAHASSPTTLTALLHELHHSQPELLARIGQSVPKMVPKAYRWVGEMQEIAGFVGAGAGADVGGSTKLDGSGAGVYHGLAGVFARVESALERRRNGTRRGDEEGGVEAGSGEGGKNADGDGFGADEVDVLTRFAELAKEASGRK